MAETKLARRKQARIVLEDESGASPAQPLQVAEPFTSTPGQRSTYGDLLDAVSEILSDNGGGRGA